MHHHLPIFHTEHCVFARFLSDGNDFRDCGRPCERHTVHLRDAASADHLMLADEGCRNTVFNAAAQSGAPQAFLKLCMEGLLLIANLVQYPMHAVDRAASCCAVVYPHTWSVSCEYYMHMLKTQLIAEEGCILT